MTSTDSPEEQSTLAFQSGVVWNVLSILVLLAMIVTMILLVMIYSKPPFRINPLSPMVGIPPSNILPTATYVNITPVPTRLPSPTFEATPIPSPSSILPTETPPEPSSTPELALLAIETDLSPTPTIETDYPFVLRATPAMIASTIIHPDEECEWMGVGGQVFDLQGASIVGLYVQLGGTLGGRAVSIPSLTGTAIHYGPAGYEIHLGDRPIASRGTLWIQLFEQGGIPISARIFFDTVNDCEKNLVLINFKQVR